VKNSLTAAFPDITKNIFKQIRSEKLHLSENPHLPPILIIIVFLIAISLHLSMENQIISNRYIRLNQLHTLLKRLFVAGYEVDVGTCRASSISINIVYIIVLI
jgi:uncharacterized membrane protein YciS (DUF1049 family)